MHRKNQSEDYGKYCCDVPVVPCQGLESLRKGALSGEIERFVF